MVDSDDRKGYENPATTVRKVRTKDGKQVRAGIYSLDETPFSGDVVLGVFYKAKISGEYIPVTPARFGSQIMEERELPEHYKRQLMEDPSTELGRSVMEGAQVPYNHA